MIGLNIVQLKLFVKKERKFGGEVAHTYKYINIIWRKLFHGFSC